MAGFIVLVAAEAREFEGLAARVSTQPLRWGLQYAREAQLHDRRAILVAHGAGFRMAGFAADAVRRKVLPEVVVSTGFCGALDPGLRTGDVLVASRVIVPERDRIYSCDTIGSAATGPLLSQDHVVCTSGEKGELRRTGALAVEMEAAAVAERAQSWSVPFYCIRSVSDSAGESFGIDFNRMRDGNGRFCRSRIAVSALARPWSRIPALLQLDRNCRKAAQSLGEFLANCRF